MAREEAVMVLEACGGHSEDKLYVEPSHSTNGAYLGLRSVEDDDLKWATHLSKESTKKLIEALQGLLGEQPEEKKPAPVAAIKEKKAVRPLKDELLFCTECGKMYLMSSSASFGGLTCKCGGMLLYVFNGEGKGQRLNYIFSHAAAFIKEHN